MGEGTVWGGGATTKRDGADGSIPMDLPLVFKHGWPPVDVENIEECAQRVQVNPEHTCAKHVTS